MNPTIGTVLKLRGKSDTGWSRLDAYGDTWRVVRTQHNVNFDTRCGYWMLLKTTYGETWCLLNQDNNFEVTGVVQ